MTTWATNAHRLRFMERNHAALAVGGDAWRRAVSATNTVSDGGAAPALNDSCIEQDDLAEIR